MKSKKSIESSKKKSEINSTKEKILEKMNTSIDVANGAIEDALSAHKWKIRRVDDDKVLDCASKCFEARRKIRKIRAKASKIKDLEGVASELVKFEKEFGWLENNLEQLFEKVS